MKRSGRIPLLVLALLCASAQAFCEPRDPVETIGTATITADGTIVLSIRSQDSAGMIAEGLFNYAPGDPNYMVVLRHIGTIVPGETVGVGPFPDERHGQGERPK
ncbi:MAG: hypothetical protein EOP12_02860 [Pseudomonas sp.]|nr:MAG: hypothetical protein EOP12_02860 [Pseudomonas sp.]